MNITTTTNVCDSKCTFNYNYSTTTIQSIITSGNITLKPGTQSVPPVNFNGNTYNVSKITITYPSSINFHGTPADGAIEITHTSTTSYNPLIVVIPFNQASTTNPPVLDSIIQQTATLLPKTAYTNLNIPNFSLQSIIPNGPFYFSESSNYYMIYYGLESALSISNKTYQQLKTIVVTPTPPFQSTSQIELFYNPDGSNLPSNGGSDFGYLECQEEYSEDVTGNTQTSPGPPSQLATLFQNPTVQQGLWIVFYVICSVMVIIGLYYAFNTDTSTIHTVTNLVSSLSPIKMNSSSSTSSSYQSNKI